MLNQITSKQIKAMISSNNLPFNLTKVGKRWVLTDNNGESHFENLKQVKNFIDLEISSNGISVDKKQGGDAIKVDTSKLVIFNKDIKAPVPTTTIDRKVTEKLKVDTSTKHHKAIVEQLKICVDDNGKECLPEELSSVQAIKGKFERTLDKYCLKFSVNGGRILSVHHRDIIDQARKEANDALKKQAQLIAVKIDDWKQESISQGRYVEGKFPSPEYFTERYECGGYFAKFSEEFKYSDTLIENQIGKLREKVNHALNVFSAYLNEGKSKPQERTIANISECFGVLKEAGLVSGEAVERIISVAESSLSQIDIDALESAKKTLEKGISTPVQGKRGRKATPITQKDFDEAQKIVDNALNPLQTLADELEGLN